MRGLDQNRAGRTATILFAAIPALVVAALLGWRMMPKPAPPPNGDPVQIAKFINTSQFESLSEYDKKQYMRTLRKKLPDVEKAANEGKLSRSEYAYAVENAWMIRQLEHMEAYYQLPEGPERQKYLDSLVEKGSKSTGNAVPTIKNEGMREEIAKRWLASWPEDRRKQWEEFRRVSHEKKQAATRAAGAATKGAA